MGTDKHRFGTKGGGRGVKDGGVEEGRIFWQRPV